MCVYRFTACLINPEIESQRESLGDLFESTLEDYKVITNPCNNLDVQYECLKKYSIEGGFQMEMNESDSFIIEEDADGVYLYERIDKLD